MPSTNDHAPRARRKARPPHIPLSFAGVQVLVVVLALFAGSVATTYALSAEFGNSVRGLEPREEQQACGRRVPRGRSEPSRTRRGPAGDVIAIVGLLVQLGSAEEMGAARFF